MSRNCVTKYVTKICHILYIMKNQFLLYYYIHFWLNTQVWKNVRTNVTKSVTKMCHTLCRKKYVTFCTEIWREMSRKMSNLRTTNKHTSHTLSQIINIIIRVMQIKMIKLAGNKKNTPHIFSYILNKPSQRAIKLNVINSSEDTI